MEKFLNDIATAFMFLVLLYILALLISLGIRILQLVSMWKLYEKAGEPNWSAIIPFYNYMQMVKIATGDFKLAWVYLILYAGYLAVVFLGNFVGGFLEAASDSEDIRNIIFIFLVPFMIVVALGFIAIQAYISYMFPKSYGKSTAFCVLSIFFSPIMIIIMGFDKSTMYVGPKGIPQNNNIFYNNRF